MTLAVAALAANGARAQDSFLDTLAKSAGLVAPATDPPDFVKSSRKDAPGEAIPVFAPPPEPHSKVKTAAELKAMDADLQRASDGAAPRKSSQAH